MNKILVVSVVTVALSLNIFAEDTSSDTGSYWERIKARAALEKSKLEDKIDTDEILDDIKNKANEIKDDVEQTVKDEIDKVDKDKIMEKIDETVYDVSQKIDIDAREQKIVGLIKSNLPESELTTKASMSIGALSDLVRATVISNKEMSMMATKTVISLDKKNTLAKKNSNYALRLAKITKNITTPDKLKLDIKVYVNKSINAFATANGSVRIYSGIMDAMTDKEVLFVIGHEIGHVKKKHSKDSYRVAYALSGLRKGAVAQGGMVGTIANSMVGQLSTSLVDAKFSRNEERSADAYGLEFLTHNGLSKKEAKAVAISSLAKLKSSSSNMLSSHPSSANRIDAIKAY